MSLVSAIPGVNAVETSAAWWAHELYPATRTPQSYLGHAGEVIAKAAHAHGVNAAYLWGIFGVETSYGSKIGRSATGAEGPLQFEPGTARALHLTVKNTSGQITDWGAFANEADAAARLLVQYGYKKNARKAIEAYNGGPGNVGSHATREYYESVLKHGGTYSRVGPGGIEPEEKAKAISEGETPKAEGAGAGLIGELIAGLGGLLTTGVLLIAGMALVVFGLITALGKGPAARAA